MGIKYYNSSKLTQLRRSLRNNQTKPEQYLWEKLKNKQFHGIKFRRQYSLGRYILDFYAPEYKIGVEIDGENHFEKHQKEYDDIRTEFLASAGIKIIRYTNNEVMNNREGMLYDLYTYF
ncbi:endonuclease domain-containing protein [Candidatus Gracilibacteria bacterium]|nr:endonuclease domain-containing protein [Candidatus Gracilibacteria bacterium]